MHRVVMVGPQEPQFEVALAKIQEEFRKMGLQPDVDKFQIKGGIESLANPTAVNAAIGEIRKRCNAFHTEEVVVIGEQGVLEFARTVHEQTEFMVCPVFMTVRFRFGTPMSHQRPHQTGVAELRNAHFLPDILVPASA